MPLPIRLALALSACIVLPGLSISASAHWVQHCQGPNGEITFTASNCPPGHALVGQQPPRRPSLAPVQRSPAKKIPAKAPQAPKKPNDSESRSVELEKKSPGNAQQKKHRPERQTTTKERKVQSNKKPTKYLPNQQAKG